MGMLKKKKKKKMKMSFMCDSYSDPPHPSIMHVTALLALYASVPTLFFSFADHHDEQEEANIR